MATGEVPNNWRKGNITPVFKKSSKEEHHEMDPPGSYAKTYGGQGDD